MPNTTKIENRTSTCISINAELLREAKEKHLNLSAIMNISLKNILNAEGEGQRIKALEIRMESLDEYVNKKNLKSEYNDWRWNKKEVKEDVVSKEKTKRNFGQAIADIENSRG